MKENKVINRLCKKNDFHNILRQSKKCIILDNGDKMYAVGNYIMLWETEGPKDAITKRTIKVKITHMDSEKFMPKGVVAVSIRISMGGSEPQTLPFDADWRNNHDRDQLKLNFG